MKKVESVLWGIVFITIGLIISGNVLGITNINIFFNGWWTLFIIIPCFIGLFKNNRKTGDIIGLIIGIALLLACQDILKFDLVWKLLFPVILIIVGISFIFRDTIGGKITKEIKELNKNRINSNEYCATFSEQNVKFDDEKFSGADLTAVFGGVKCDLRKAIIEENGRFYVYYKTPTGEMERKEVEIGIDNGVNIEILSGLEEGDTIYLASRVSSENAVMSNESNTNSNASGNNPGNNSGNNPENNSENSPENMEFNLPEGGFDNMEGMPGGAFEGGTMPGGMPGGGQMTPGGQMPEGEGMPPGGKGR